MFSYCQCTIVFYCHLILKLSPTNKNTDQELHTKTVYSTITVELVKYKS